MSGSATVREWAADVRRFANGWPMQGGRVAAETVGRQVAADTGGDGRLSNHPGGAAGAAVEGGPGEATVTATGSAGVWAILEYGTRAHTVLPKGRFLLTPQGPRRMVQVAGVNARQTWSKGSIAGVVEAEREADLMFGAI